MAESVEGSLYQKQYEEAKALFDSAPKAGIEMAKFNLTDPTLPPYYIIRNCILIACALDDWEHAEVWRLSAEQQYTTTLAEVTRKRDDESLPLLQQLREELDHLQQFKEEDMHMSDLEDEDEDEDEDDEEEAVDREFEQVEMQFEDSEAVARAENEVEVAADHMTLSLRSPATADPPATSGDHLTVPTDEQSTGTAAGKRSRRKKGGGAVNMLEFTRSIRRSPSPRPSIIDMDWRERK